MKNKIHLIILTFLLVFTHLSFISAQEEFPAVPNDRSDPSSSIFELPLFLSLIGFLIFILLVRLIKIKGNKKLWIGALIGGLYGFIPLLGAILYTGTAGGDPGPYWTYMFFPFWPLSITFYMLVFLTSLFSLSESTAFAISSFINLFVWILIGYFIGLLIKKMRRRK